MEMVVKEKEFREKIKEHDWHQYKDKNVLVQCSVNTILPVWAKMLIAIQLEGIVSNVFFGGMNDYLYVWYKEIIDKIDLTPYKNQKIIVKGCSKREIPDTVFAYITLKLKSVAKSIMFGEACSNVPIYKNKEI